MQGRGRKHPLGGVLVGLFVLSFVGFFGYATGLAAAFGANPGLVVLGFAYLLLVLVLGMRSARRLASGRRGARPRPTAPPPPLPPPPIAFAPCPACGRQVSPRTGRCPYCGTGFGGTAPAPAAEPGRAWEVGDSGADLEVEGGQVAHLAPGATVAEVGRAAGRVLVATAEGWGGWMEADQLRPPGRPG